MHLNTLILGGVIHENIILFFLNFYILIRSIHLKQKIADLSINASSLVKVEPLKC